MNIYFDFEFTGLHKNTTPISIGLITDSGHEFYAEFNDYDKTQCDDWIEKNVISNLLFNDKLMYLEMDADKKIYLIKNDKETISLMLTNWLNQFKKLEFWGDCVAYDWILFMDLLGMGKPMRKVPKNFTSYQAYDVHTLLKQAGMDSKKNRHVLLGIEPSLNHHNSLYDAGITKQMYELICGTGKNS
jgi:hypothetical protein